MGKWRLREFERVLPKTAQLTRARALLSPPQGALSLYWSTECFCHLLDFVPNAGDDFPHSWTSLNISVPCSCAPYTIAELKGNPVTPGPFRGILTPL